MYFMQQTVGDAELIEVCDCVGDIVCIGAALPARAAYRDRRLLRTKLADILGVGAIYDEGQRLDLAAEVRLSIAIPKNFASTKESVGRIRGQSHMYHRFYKACHPQKDFGIRCERKILSIEFFIHE